MIKLDEDVEEDSRKTKNLTKKREIIRKQVSILMNSLEDVITQESSRWESKKTTEETLFRFLRRSFLLSFEKLFGYKKTFRKTHLIYLVNSLLEKTQIKILTKENFDINTGENNSRKEICYFNPKKVQKAGIENKIGFYQEKISYLEIYNLCGKPNPLRFVKRKNNILEFWDTKENIEKMFQILQNRTDLLPRGLKIYKYINQMKTKSIIQGKRTLNNTKIKINIGTLNICGLNEINKSERLENQLLNNKIDICFIEETKIDSKINFKFYDSIMKKAIINTTNKKIGGLLIIYKKILGDFINEIIIDDKDILIIKFLDYILINIYIYNSRTQKRTVESMEIINRLMNQYQLKKTIIGGDWNIPFNTIYKKIKNIKFHPIKNTQKSRVRDIDYFITNTEIKQTSVTTQSEISDHNMITNKLSIEKNQEIKNIYIK
ncbi:hypothetical protein M0812_20025 [Anaeramoeba flamelloides]|uniref:Endonuclease/exonuclease/phosphatase domain-containing protein n=1 Tax=Anaeramoeba flamelloides TaxID=1746091 RepID=A0AAV7Z1N4_9EUKA|nr:hypothetical protein M0812_20025 [Anaeramoeba flamelloides]